MEETKVITLDGQPAQEATSVTIIKRVMETAIVNRKIIDEKKLKASATIEAILKKITLIKIGDTKTDEYVEKAIVAINNVLVDMEKLRKEYTATVRNWLTEEITPENELKLQLQKLRDLRNDLAKRTREEHDKRQKEIDAQKNKELYEHEVKKDMRFNFDKGIIDKVVAFDKSIADHFKNLTVANAAKMKSQFEALEPKLKEDVFQSWFTVAYDSTKMTAQEYDALVVRAKTFWKYDEINAKYVNEAKGILKKYIDSIPQRVKELSLMAAGGPEGERVKKIVSEREAAESKEFAQGVQTKINQAATAANEEARGATMSTEFKAQAGSQKKTNSTASTREDVFFVLDNPLDTLQVSTVIGSIIIHTIAHKTAEQKAKMIVLHDADGKPKKDADGNPMYTPGVQFWLDIAATFGHTPDIKGLTKRFKVRAINKAK
jgi:hypothetical protein